MRFIQTNANTWFRIEDISGVRDEGPHCSVKVDGEWEPTTMETIDVLRILEGIEPDGQ